MIRLRRRGIHYRTSGRFFDMKGNFVGLQQKRSWKSKDRINVFVVNSLFKKLGISVTPCFGKILCVEVQSKSGTGLINSGNTLAHEVGHFIGIQHHSGNKTKDRNNLMYTKDKVADYGKKRRNLTTDQIEKVHRVLSKNISRRRYRIE